MKQSTITLVKGEKRVSLSLSLGEDLATRKLAYIKGGFVGDIKHHNNDRVLWGPKEWEIAVLSGARYAFRIMNTCHKQIFIHSLEGVLDEEDAEGVSIASAIAIVSLLGGDRLSVATGEWREMPCSPKVLSENSSR
ncbi:MAG TPA: hypothetical protein VF306_23750 [Pirellulales bacterium]